MITLSTSWLLTCLSAVWCWVGSVQWVNQSCFSGNNCAFCGWQQGLGEFVVWKEKGAKKMSRDA